MTRPDVVQALAEANPVDDVDVASWRTTNSAQLRDQVRANIEHRPISQDLDMARPRRQPRMRSIGLVAAGAAVAGLIVLGVSVSWDRDREQSVQTAPVGNSSDSSLPRSSEPAGQTPRPPLGEAPALTETEQDALASRIASISAANANAILGTYTEGGWFVVVAAHGQSAAVHDLFASEQGPVAFSECAVSQAEVEQSLREVESAGPLLDGSFTYSFQPATCDVLVSVSASVSAASQRAFLAALGSDSAPSIRMEVAPGEYVTFGGERP